MPDPLPVVTASCPARAALAGNPSDGYGGTVVAVPVPTLAATVTLHPGGSVFRVGATVLGPWEQVAAPARTCMSARTPADGVGAGTNGGAGRVGGADIGHDGLAALVGATLRRTARHLDVEPPSCTIDVATTIPESVGLAGSSAIVIATIRALVLHVGASTLPPDEVASLALAVEIEELGLAAGLQDRVVQAHGRPLVMRFGTAHTRTVGGLVAGTYAPVEMPGEFHLFVAHDARAAAPSDATHAGLRARFERGDRDVREAIEDLAAEGEDAAAAFRHGDLHRLGAAMDRSYDLRRTITDVAPVHDAMVATARAAGCHANSAGSGGAITVLAPDAGTAHAARQELAATGATITPIHPAP